MSPTDLAPECSKCGKPLDTEGYPRWCRECRAKYKKDYESTRREMSETRGYAAGISAFRATLVREFARLGSGQFSGYEIAHLILQANPNEDFNAPETAETSARPRL